MKKNLVLLILLVSFLKAAVITDILGRDVEVKDGPRKVVLTFYFEEYFTLAGEKGFKNIVGWSKNYWLGRRQATWDEFSKKYPKIDQIPDVGYSAKNSISYEKIISLKPDVVLFPAIDYEKAKGEIPNLKKAGIASLFIDFHTQSLENHNKSIEILGKLVNDEQRAADVNEFYNKQINLILNRLKENRLLKKPKVYVEFSQKEGPQAFGPTFGKKMWGALIEQCGGENIAKDLVKGSSATINPEFILASNPDIIIFAGNYFKNSFENIPLGYGVSKKTAAANFDKYAQRNGWSELNAVKNRQIYALYHDLSRHIFDFAGFLYFAKTIHPEIFADIDPEQRLREFFDKFYPIALSGTWMISW